MSAAHSASSAARDGRVIGTVEPSLTHMRDIEQAGLGARVGVFGENAVAILDRHVVAGERREARAVFAVQGVKRGEQQRRHGPAQRFSAQEPTPRAPSVG